MLGRGCFLAVVWLSAGCASWPASGGGPARTQSDVLRDSYADLTTGRFAVIADFEDSAHAELFRVRTHRTEAAPGGRRMQSPTGVSATGGTCLKVVLDGPASQLIADNSAARSWLLKRDWRPYNLLIMNVHSPASGLQLDLCLVAGAGEFVSEAHALLPLHVGWNLLRLDLADAADYVALDDIRQIRWSIPNAARRVTLKLDDVLLTDNHAALVGAGDGPPGSVYVERQGRRINVGAVGRFELGFANGQIVRWFSLEDDPHRLNDLVGAGNTMGPMPVVLSDQSDRLGGVVAPLPAGFASLGEMVVARQRVVEANAVRVIVESQWTFGDVEVAEGDDSPQARWTYAIYPSGHVFVSFDCTTEHASFKPEHLGLVVSRLPTAGMLAESHEPIMLRDRPIHRNISYAWMTASEREAGLLYVAHDSRQFPQITAVWDARTPRVSLVARGGEVNYPRHRGHCLLSVWPRGNCAAAARRRTAISYCRKPHMEFLVGGLARDTPGDDDGDGFNERCGTLMLAPDANRVQLRLDGRKRTIVSPAFCVLGSAGREAWIYVDYAIHKHVARSADETLLFQLPGNIKDEVIVEVYLRTPPGS